MKKRFLMAFASFVFVTALSTAPFSASDNVSYTAYAESQYSVSYPTQDQIRSKYYEYALDFKSVSTYTESYSLSAPYSAGDISDYDRRNALNALNFCRYIAGLPADVGLSDEYNEYAQVASLVNAANSKLSHYPTQPNGMSDALYQIGYDGASHSNIAMGYTNLADSIISGYMEDSDSGNIDRVGHRRWILYPELQTVGIGNVGRYSALYVINDDVREGTFTGDYVAWPPANMPVELYKSYSNNYAFSVTLGDSYDTPDLAKITVEISSEKLGKTWKLNRASTDISEYLTVSNDYYGDPKCIIFNVGMFPDDDTVSVKIKGTTKGGTASPISYTVNFFELAQGHTHNYKIASIKAASCTTVGVKTYTCDGCGDTYSESIPKIPHNYSAEWTIDKKPTCSVEGTKSHHCTICNAKVDISPIEKLEHKYTSVITKPATCAAEGVKTNTCSVCGDVATESISKVAHTYSSEWITDKQPTCIEEGSKSHHCEVCGDKSNVTAIPKTNHLYSSKTTKEPTCIASGVITNTCTICGDANTQAIPALGHNYGEYKVKVQPTVDKEGTEQRTCSQCGAIETRTIAKLSDTSSGNSNGSTSGSGSDGNSNGSANGSGSDGNSNGSANGSGSDGNANGSANGNGSDGNANGSANGSGSDGNANGSANGSGSDGNANGSANGSGSDGNANGSANGSGSDGNANGSANGSGSDGNDSGSNVSDNPTVTPAEFIKQNLTVILLAFCSAAVIIIAVIIGVLSKKNKK